MKLPRHAPSFQSLLEENPQALAKILALRMPLESEVAGEYSHWDDLYYKTPASAWPSREQWWLAIKMARSAGRRQLKLLDKAGKPFSIALSDAMSRRLHFLDREAAGSILGLRQGDGQESRDGYLVRALIEEAMTSSQLEGASTTRVIAKEMLRTGRVPRDRSEMMIFNNYQAMRRIRQGFNEPLTIERIFEIHRIICAETLADSDSVGRFRRKDEPIGVYDHRDGTLLHEPPPAEQLGARMEQLCAFANDEAAGSFLHPIVRAICIHFQIGYLHPFVDGNGRVARALFYWAMGRAGYWLTEFVSISAVLRKAPAQYARAYLFTEDDEGDLGYFVDHQLRVLEQAVEGFRGYLRRKTEESERAKRLLSGKNQLAGSLNHRQRALLLHALKNPSRSFRIAEHQSHHQIAYQSARSDLLNLVHLGLLRKRHQGKAFVFQSVPDLVQRLELPP